jgi:hypothetical protein
MLKKKRFSAYANPRKARKANPKSTVVVLAFKGFHCSVWFSPSIELEKQ